MTTVHAVVRQEVGLQEREPEAVIRFKADVAAGEPWLPALLRAVERWDLPAEVYGDRFYVYYIGDEALDWLVLAERLLHAVQGLVDPQEVEDLLFSAQLPEPLSADEFRQLIGPAKHRAVTNYWYGVAVEEALLVVVEREVRKSRRSSGKPEETKLDDTVYERIYGLTEKDLLKQFFVQRKELQPKEISLTLMKEFHYWLFKYRLRISDPARLASDTKKGLDFLRSHRLGRLYGF